MLALTFFGKAKYDAKHVHPHESPKAMTIPLILLAVLSITGGWVGIPGALNQFGKWVHFGEEHAGFSLPIAALSTAMALAGFATGWAIFAMGRTRIDLRASALGWLYRLLENKYYLDDFYMSFIVVPIRERWSRVAYWTNQNILDRVVNVAGTATVKTGFGIYRDIDQSLIDGFVNGLAGFAGLLGSKLRFWQAGNMQRNAAALFLGVTVLVGAFVFFRV
jgi:NADH-quinone oxidoreductase subunit L